MQDVGTAKGSLVVVASMNDTPGCCLFCGTSPMDEDNSPLPAIEVLGIDVNWGDSVYICDECTDIICDLKGRVSQQEHDNLIEQHKFVKRRLASVIKKSNGILTAAKKVAEGDQSREELKGLLAEAKKEKN